MPISLPPLPYEIDALAPHISARTIEFHYGKHHRGYVDTLIKLIEGTRFSSATLVEIVREANKSTEQTIFNNAGQAWNHDFYWRSMTPDGGARAKRSVPGCDQRFLWRL